jgi:hypothetical protein
LTHDNTDFETKYDEEQEKRIVEKALRKDKGNMAFLNRTFPYISRPVILRELFSFLHIPLY